MTKPVLIFNSQYSIVIRQLKGPLVLSIALEGKDDKDRFKALGWGLRAWDNWYFNDLDRRFGDDWPGQIPAQLVGHTLHFFRQDKQDIKIARKSC